MKLETGTVLEPPLATRPGGAWPAAAGIAVAGLVALLLVYLDTVASMVNIWARSETFAHGYLIAPISAFLVWRQRHALAAITPRPSWWGLAAIAGAGAVWVVAEVAQVQVVRQLALVALVCGFVLTVLGYRVAWQLAFPLGFLFLAVPMGEALIPPLMDFTADFTVAALQLTGIPVYREGTFFSIPSGNWSVVEGCSGLRYLIASITCGVLYAYLSYDSFVKRVLFIAASVVVPVIANGLRAYMIVMIAHLSDMRLALGVDHFIYGWVFFGIVMLILFWLGSFWHDPAPRERSAAVPAPAADAPMAGIFAATVVALAVAAVWPAYAAHLERSAAAAEAVKLAPPAGANGWSAGADFTGWRPQYQGTDAAAFQTYRKGDREVALYLGYYRNQRQDHELINSRNVMIHQKDPVWSNVGEARRAAGIGAGPDEVRQTKLRSAGQRLLVWDWFVISEHHLTSPYLGKALLARDKLLGRGDDGAAIILATPYEEGAGEPEATLREFARDMLPAIEAALAEASR